MAGHKAVKLEMTRRPLFRRRLDIPAAWGGFLHWRGSWRIHGKTPALQLLNSTLAPLSPQPQNLC